MIIGGFDKLSLLNYPGEVAATIFLAGCNFRCPFCHNYEFVTFNEDVYEVIDENVILSYLEKRKGMLSGVAITGGEPTLYKDLKDLIIKIKSLGYKVKLDTNGTNPDMVIDLLESNLVDYVAMDIKNSKEKYLETIGLSSFDLTSVERLVNYFLSHDYDYELRTTVMEPFHTNESMEELAKWIKGAKRYYLQKFELTDNVPDRTITPISNEKALGFKMIIKKYVDNVELRGFDL